MNKLYFSFLIAITFSFHQNTFSDISFPEYVKPLIKTKWGQNSYYSQALPKYNGKTTYPGCATIALAQIIKYYSHLSHPIGNINYYWEYPNSNSGQPISFDFDNIDPINYYRWDMMPNKLTRNSSAIEKTQVNRLILHVALALNTQFGTGKSDSAAGGKFIDNALKNHFLFQRGRFTRSKLKCDFNDIKFYSDQEWINILKKEISNGRPVIYTALSLNDNGHTFIVDGYNKRDEFHINWGWSGKQDGYYKLTNITPKKTGKPNEVFSIIPTIYPGIIPKI